MDRRKPGRFQPKNDDRIDVWRELRVPEADYEDEALAPPVDRELLRGLVRRELPEARVREVCELTVRFRSWAGALDEVATESFRENNPKQPPLRDEPT